MGGTSGHEFVCVPNVKKWEAGKEKWELDGIERTVQKRPFRASPGFPLPLAIVAASSCTVTWHQNHVTPFHLVMAKVEGQIITSLWITLS